MRTSEREDVYRRVTDRIVAAIEAGVARGERGLPWRHGGQAITAPVNVVSRKPYRGVNTVALWAAAYTDGYPTGIWGTYRQWQAMGAQVRKGSLGCAVVFWKIAGRDEGGGEDPQVSSAGAEGPASEDEKATTRPVFARAYTVFNSAQVEGYTPPAMPILPEAARIERAERFCANLGIETRHGDSRAFYSPGGDFVQMPEFRYFEDAVAYYAVLLHECGHATGARHRLDRDLSGRFGSAAYAMEECIVELLSAMICAEQGLSIEPRPDHALYVASWLEVLRSDSRAIFTAASKAQQAADWMHAQQGGVEVRSAA